MAGIAAQSPTGRSATDALVSPPQSPYSPIVAAEPNVKELAMLALDAAKSAGADYADVRFVRNRKPERFDARAARVGRLRQRDLRLRRSHARRRRVGLRRESRSDEGRGRRASRSRRSRRRSANRSALVRPVVLAPAPVVANGTWKSPIEIDPFDVAIEDKVALLLAANQAALEREGRAVRQLEHVLPPRGEDVRVHRRQLHRSDDLPHAAGDDGHRGRQRRLRHARVERRSRRAASATSTCATRSSSRTRRSGPSEAVQKLSAKSVDVGRYDLVLHPSHLWLTIHESVAHPTELDRAMGYEANYAGTSFVAPPEKVLGTLKYGSELMNIRGDRTQAGSLSACGWDDEGVKPEEFDIIKKGMFVDYHTTREQAPWLDWYYKKIGKPTRSHGCSYAQTWAAVQFQRMPNVSLLPGDKDLGWDDLIAATDRGIAIIGDGSFSIDQQRYNAQFGGQVFYEIKGGKIVGMLKDVAYQMKTPEFWASLDMIGGQKSYFLGGAFGDAKGQPVQVNAVSHGAPVTRFRNVNVINTGRTA